MNYATIKYCDIANGEGVRTSLFVSGCPHHCTGCFNEIAWDYNYGDTYDDEIQDKILDSLNYPYIAGLSILGGEPLCFNNIYRVSKLVKECRKRYGDSKDIWIYSGYTLEELEDQYEKGQSIFFRTCYNIIINNIDVLVDGRFVEDLKDISLKFRGSSNQRIINMKETIKSDNIKLYYTED